MPTIDDVKDGDIVGIIVMIIIGGLGFFLALTLANALQATIDAVLPDNTEKTARAWIIFGVAAVLVVLFVTMIVLLYKRANRRM